MADEPNQAGLLIDFGDGRVETRCIAFDEEEITGADLLLTYSGLDMVIDASSGMGITVCQLEGEGCAYPSEHCFCQCMGGGACAYWNYFYREPGSSEWTYSALGAVLRREGWYPFEALEAAVRETQREEIAVLNLEALEASARLLD